MATTELSLTEQKNPQIADDVYDDGYLRIEHHNYYVACGGQALRLPRTEFLILSRLARSHCAQPRHRLFPKRPAAGSAGR